MINKQPIYIILECKIMCRAKGSILSLLILLAAGLCSAVPKLQGSNEILQDRARRTPKVAPVPVPQPPAPAEQSHATGVFCGDPGTPVNGTSLYNSHYEGAIVIHSCDYGHLLVGSTRRLCEKHGRWIPDLPHCVLVDCGDPGVPLYGTRWLLHTYFSSAVKYSCNKGYVLTGDATRLCQSNGKWSGSLPTCKGKGCPFLPFVKNGHVTIQDTKSGAIGKYTCEPGFVLVGKSTRTCGLNGVWQGKAPSCESVKVKCGTLQYPDNGVVSFKSTTPGSIATYSCFLGYVLVGTRKRTCNSDGQWSGSTPVCRGQVLSCPSLPAIMNGQLLVAGDRPGTVAQYVCNKGFTLVGDSQRTCQISGEWTSTDPFCRKDVDCGSLQSPQNGYVSFLSTTPGSTATYSCFEGFELIGTATRRCEDNGQWSSSTPECRAQVLSCPPLPDIKNGQLIVAGNSPGTVAHYVCDKGFTLVGDNYRTCQISGEWTSMDPFCRKDVDCGSLQSPQNGYVSFLSTTPGSTATYSCFQGFELVGKVTRRCEDNGQWSGSAPECRTQVLSCPPLPGFKNGQLIVAGNRPGTVALYVCDKGFTLVGDNQRICQNDGRWSATQPFCREVIVVNCNPLANPQNGQVLFTSLSQGSVATYSCMTGFLLVGAETRVCQASGEWSSSVPACNIADCGGLSHPQNGFVSVSSTTFGSVATYACETSYQLLGTSQRTCQADGSWSGSEPRCEKTVVAQCGTLPGPNNGRVFLSGTTVGSLATYVCEASFRLEGSRNRVCLVTGEWSETEPSCIRTGCNTLSSPASGHITLTGTFTGAVATYSCSNAHNLVGAPIRVCLPSGQWSSTAPYCEREGCGLLTPPTNGRISFSAANRVNSIATYLCDPGFVLVGVETRRCDINGVWSGTEPYCRGQQQTFCPPLDSPKDGKVSFSGTTEGSVAFYSCLYGYSLEGDIQRVCLQGGYWSGNEPVCRGVQCGSIPPPENGVVEFSEGTTFGSFATYSCFSPYQLAGAAVRVCQAGGAWSDVAPICEILRCPELATPLFGVIIQSGDIPGSTAEYSCASGYFLEGQEVRNCLNNGFWSGEDPECLRTDCGPLSDPKNGEVEFSGTLAGSSASYTCNEGYTLEGSRYRECLETGRWSGEEPDCVGLICEVLNDPANGAVEILGVELGDTASYSCNQGYELVGKDVKRQCLLDGTWSGEEPVCRGLNCSSLPDPPHGYVEVLSTTVGSKATYTCDDSFSLVGRSVRECEVGGVWSGAEPRCVANVCPTLNNPTNGRVVQQGNMFGDKATYSCSPGYKRDGHVTRSCLASGVWSNIPPQCNPILCKSIVPPPRGRVLLSDGMKFGSVATYECNEGYNLGGGQPTRSCNANGHWTGLEPYCGLVECGALPHPSNGGVSVSGLTFDSIASYSCFDHYVLEGAEVRRCQADGSWSGVAPICRFQVFDCGTLSPPLNGHVTFSGTTTGSMAAYSCDPGYSLQGGNDRQRCVNEIGWDGIPPKCQPVDCGLLLPPLFGQVSTSDGSLFGSVATYTCDKGHTLDGTSFRSCLSDAEWTGLAPLCLPIDCGPVPRPQNGLIFFSGTTFGLMVAYSCNTGYELLGVSERTCQEDGLWSDSAPTCARSDDSYCEDPGVPDHGNKVGEDYSSGATVSFECHAGYHLVGSDYITCLPNAEWSGSIPSCSAAVDDSECSSEGDTVFDKCGQRCTCRHGRYVDCCRVRPDYAGMPVEDKHRYIRAVKELATSPAYKSRYDALVATYTASYGSPAQATDPESSQFLVWNRYFLVQYENLLREIDCRITVPYWDWTALPMNPYTSTVFNTDYGFGNSHAEANYCVNNGPFSYTDFAVTPSAGAGCLEREYKHEMYPTRAIVEQDLLTLPASEFDEFHRFLQLFIFGNVRCFIGGHMCGPGAANDPLMLLHMAQTDAIFTRWQSIDVSRLNARYVSDNRPLMLTDSNMVVADYSNNQDLPNDVSVCYGKPAFKSHVPEGMTPFSRALLEVTNNHDLKMGCVEQPEGGGALGTKEEEFLKRVCGGVGA